MNYTTTTMGGKGAVKQLLALLLSVALAITLACTSFPAPLAYAENAPIISFTEAKP